MWIFFNVYSYSVLVLLLVYRLSILQLKEENSVYGSDEEVDDQPEVDTDEDFSDDGDKEVHEEV